MHLLTSLFSEKTLTSKTLCKDQLMMVLITSRVSVSRKLRTSSPREKDGLSPAFLRDRRGQSQFLCIDLSEYPDHFSFPQNNCAYAPCVNLTPLICAMYLTIHFMFSQISLCSVIAYIVWFLTVVFFSHFSESENSRF